MKKSIYVLALCLLSMSNAFSGNWMNSLEDGKKIAMATNKLILVDFWATWCGPCRKMDSESWSKEDVSLLMNNYVSVKLNIDENRSLAQKYGVQGIPYVFILDATGKILYQQMSYKTKPQVMTLLKKYAINTEYMFNEYVYYSKSKTLSTTSRLAAKSQDFSLHLKGDLRKAYLNVSNEYLNEAEKLLKKEKGTKFEKLALKMNLLSIQNVLYRGKAKKALKMMGDLNVDELSGYTYAQFCFLNCVAYKYKKDEVNEDIWQQKLMSTGKSASFKKKMELLFG